MKVKAGFDGILPQPQFFEHAMLNTGALPAEQVMGSEGLDHIGRQRITIYQRLINSRTLTLQMTGRKISGRFDVGLVWPADAAYVLHLFKKSQPFISGRHIAIVLKESIETLSPASLIIKRTSGALVYTVSQY
jgi:hypothetical protein